MVNIRLRTCLLLFFALLWIVINEGCFTKRSLPSGQIYNLQYKEVTLLHIEDKDFELRNPEIKDSMLIGDIFNYQKNDDKKSHLHVYINESDSLIILDGNKTGVPLSAIDRIEVYDLHVGRTILVTAATIAAIAIIVNTIDIKDGSDTSAPPATSTSTTETSCPFVYVQHEEKNEFIGEVYAGATPEYLERHDYLKIPLNEMPSGLCKIRFDNPLNEIQNTNLMELVVIDHPEDVEVEYDKYGNLHTVSNPLCPVKAYNENGTSVLNKIRACDSISYWGGDEPCVNMKDELFLTFKNENQNGKAKLIVNSKNTIWLDHLYSQFINLSGRRYKDFNKKAGAFPTGDIRRRRLEHGVPLALYLKIQDRWQLIDDYEMVGPLNNKQQLIEFDISEIEGDWIEVKLMAGKYFWSIDHIAMDFSPNRDYKEQRCVMRSCKTSYSNEMIDEVLGDDDRYIRQRINDKIDVCFEVPDRKEGMQQSLILHTKGYYEIQNIAQSRPQRKQLKRFQEPGYFMVFSHEKIKQKIVEMNN